MKAAGTGAIKVAGAVPQSKIELDIRIRAVEPELPDYTRWSGVKPFN